MKRKILMMLMTFTVSAAILAGCSKDDTEKKRIDTEETRRTEDDNETLDDIDFDDETLDDIDFDDEILDDIDFDDETLDDIDFDDETSEDIDSDEKTLSDYFAEPGVQEQMDADIAAAKEAYASTYSDIRREVDGNTLVYIYVYKDPIPEDEIEAFQETMDSSLSEAVKEQNLIGITEQQSGVEGISLQYIYCNPDGTEIFNKTYSE